MILIVPLRNISFAGEDSMTSATGKKGKALIEVSGTVWSKNEYGRNKTPLKGCTITLYDEKYNYIMALNTGKEGTYSLILDQGTTYVVILKMDGFMTRRMKITTLDDSMTAGGMEQINITLTPASYTTPFATTN